MLSCEDAVRVNGKFDLDNGNGSKPRVRRGKGEPRGEFCLSLWIDYGWMGVGWNLRNDKRRWHC